MNGKAIVGVIVIIFIAGMAYILLSSGSSQLDSVISQDVSEDIAVVDVKFPSWLSTHHYRETIENLVGSQASTLQQQALDAKERSSDAELLPYRYSAKITSHKASEEFESIVVHEQVYTGGAHENTLYYTYTFVYETLITLEEYLEIIESDSDEILSRINSNLASDGHETLTSINEARAWNVVENKDGALGIRVIFPPYQVASFAYGTIVYTIY